MTDLEYQNAKKIHDELDELANTIEMLQKDLPARELKLNGIELHLNKTEFDTFRKNALESVRARRNKLLDKFRAL